MKLWEVVCHEVVGKFNHIFQIIPLDQCKAAYRVGDVSDNMFCAMEKDRDSCDGDSGGPLEYFNKHFYNEQVSRCCAGLKIYWKFTQDWLH